MKADVNERATYHDGRRTGTDDCTIPILAAQGISEPSFSY